MTGSSSSSFDDGPGRSPGHIEGLVAGVYVGLEDAGEGLQVCDRVIAGAVGQVARPGPDSNEISPPCPALGVLPTAPRSADKGDGIG